LSRIGLFGSILPKYREPHFRVAKATISAAGHRYHRCKETFHNRISSSALPPVMLAI
jgi:hypothetical protein